MRLYLIRHGETALNAKGCYYGRTDAVLSEKGISQARYLKEILKEEKFCEGIYSTNYIKEVAPQERIDTSFKHLKFYEILAGVEARRMGM